MSTLQVFIQGGEMPFKKKEIDIELAIQKYKDGERMEDLGRYFNMHWRTIVYKMRDVGFTPDFRRYTGKSSKNWTGCGDISGDRFSNLRGGARNRNIEFDITVEDCWNLFVSQNGLCAITGRPLNLAQSENTEGSASLDRINSNIGYKIGNIWWIENHINWMKLNKPLEHLLYWCKKVRDHHVCQK